MAKYDNIDKAIYDAPTTKERLKLASEPDEFEVIELPILIEQFEEWKKENEGSFNDFLNDSGKKQTFKEGGSTERYQDLIDAFEKGIDVIPGETLTQYVSRNMKDKS